MNDLIDEQFWCGSDRIQALRTRIDRYQATMNKVHRSVNHMLKAKIHADLLYNIYEIIGMALALKLPKLLQLKKVLLQLKNLYN